MSLFSVIVLDVDHSYSLFTFFYLKGKENKEENAILSSGSLPKCPQQPAGPRPRPKLKEGAKTSIQVCKVGGRNPGFKTECAVFQGAYQQEAGIRRRIKTWIDMCTLSCAKHQSIFILTLCCVIFLSST